MSNLKLGKLPDRASVKLTISLSPELNRQLGSYAALYKQAYGEEEAVTELVPFMLEAFLAGDKAFKSASKTVTASSSSGPPNRRSTG